MPDLNVLFFGAILVVLVLFMFRNGRKRQRDQQTLAESLKPGAEVMTTFGLFGTVESVDEAENKLVLRTGPTSEVTIHRQAVGRVVTPAPGTEEPGTTAAVSDDLVEPETDLPVVDEGSPRGTARRATEE
jgi:preprotein translocase subunit YajC